MRVWLVFVAGVVAALSSVWALDSTLSESWSMVPTALYAVIVLGSGVGAMRVRRHRERADRSADEGSIEREIASQAASATFGSSLVAMVGFGLYLVVTEQFGPALVLYLLVLLVVLAYWVHYALIRRRLT